MPHAERTVYVCGPYCICVPKLTENFIILWPIFYTKLVYKYELQYFVLNTISSLFLVYFALYTVRFWQSTCMYVFQAISTCRFWKAHNTLFNSKRLAKEPCQLLTIATQFYTCTLLYCSYLTEYRIDPMKVVCDQMSFRLNWFQRNGVHLFTDAFSSVITTGD